VNIKGNEATLATAARTNVTKSEQKKGFTKNDNGSALMLNIVIGVVIKVTQ